MLRVLIIDDEKMILDMIKQTLARNNYNVDTAQSAAEGIRKFCPGDFDLVIIDVCLPGNDDNAILGRIRQLQQRKVPIMGISGTPWMLNKQDFDLILPKPFSIKTLTESIETLIGNDVSMDSRKVVNG